MSPGRKAWSKINDVSPGDAGFPFPPWQRPRPQPRTRSVLNRDRIVEVALQIIDAEGTDAVSMRRIATELGTGAASLYAYVSGKDEVLTLAHDLVIAEMDIPQLQGQDWQAMVRDWAWQVYRLYSRHQDIARLSFAEIPTGPRSLDVSERLLGGMVDSGVPVQMAAWLVDRLALYVSADALEGWMMGQKLAASSPKDRRNSAERIRDWLAGLRDYFGSLPPERYPNLVTHLEVMMSGGSDERFGFGLELMIEGVTAMAAKQQTRPKNPS